MASRTPSPSRAPSPLESPDLPLASRSLKRRRAPSPSPGPVLPVEDSGKEKTRRVNPYRLAERLGEDLVAELDSFIYPGAKMVSAVGEHLRRNLSLFSPLIQNVRLSKTNFWSTAGIYTIICIREVSRDTSHATNRAHGT